MSSARKKDSARRFRARQSARADGARIDAATRANLELTRTLSGAREGSLLSVVDLTVTPGGARLLAERIAAPLTDARLIAARLDAVALLSRKAGSARARFARSCARAPDLSRALSRLSLERGGPRDLASVGVALDAARDIAALFAPLDPPSEIAAEAQTLSQADIALAGKSPQLEETSLPLDRRNGDFIREGRDSEFDEARRLRDASRKVIAELQGRYAELTGDEAQDQAQ